MKKILATMVAALSMAAAMPAEAQSSSLAACLSMPEGLPRLACYDELHGRASSSSSAGSEAESFPQGETTFEAWKLVSEKNPIDDTVTFMAVVGSTPTWGERVSQHHLVIRCSAGSLEVFVNWRRPVSSVGEHQVTVRLGNERPWTPQWDRSTDRMSSFIVGPSFFARDLSKVETVAVQTISATGSPMVGAFSVKGLPSILKRMETSCGWYDG